MKKMIMMLCAMLLVFSAGVASAASVTILNPSFEDPTLGENEFDNDINSWDESNDIQNTSWTSSWNPEDSDFISIPNDYNVGLIYKTGWIAQGLSVNLTVNTKYTLRVSVGKLSGDNSPQGYVGLGVTGSPSSGSVLDSTYFSFFDWSTPGGEFRLAEVTYETPTESTKIGEPLWIYLMSTSNNSSVAFDNVTLETTLVPIPGAIWLLGSGLIGIVGVRRKLRK